MKTGVWLHGDSLSKRDPALQKYPTAPTVFVFDRPFLETARLSFKRIFFLYECAVLAVTESPSPRWREGLVRLREKVEVEVLPAEGMVAVPNGYSVKRFTPFWKDLGREWV